tara:strand:+ start:239 stop:460 length:222 start_codon:yes stop_codon:yes gene_type:complete
MLKINTVTMKDEIEDILMNSYDKFGNFDEPKATEELLNLFSVMNSNTKKEMEKYRDETAIETIARLQQKDYYS